MNKRFFIILFIVVILLSGCAKKPNDIFKACLKGNLASVKAIVEKYPDSIELLDELGTSPIFSAAICPNPDVVRFLISKRVDVNKKYLGFAPIAFAIRKNKFETVKVFLDNGVDINADIYSGLTPLHFAASDEKNIEMIKYFLIDKNANVNAKNNYLKISTLQVAKEAKNEIIIVLLKGFGARD